MQSRYDLPFSVAVFHLKVADGEVTREKIAVSVDEELKDIAAVLTETVRDTDLVARYDKETFVVLLPNTVLAAAIRFTQRALATGQDKIVHSFFAGTATACDADDPASLLRRAVDASRQATAAGEKVVYYHDGRTSHPSREEEVAELETVALGD
jgi:PleD family two-component response regulator